MGEALILAIDQGTTGTTVLAVSESGEVRGKGYAEVAQHFPRPGWVEHDPAQIWESVLAATESALAQAAAGPDLVRAVGLTNQRETLVIWNRNSLEPVERAIVWQDRRTAGLCEELREAGHSDRVRALTGLVIDPYFTATKLRWSLDNLPLEAGTEDIAGTVDSWLLANLTGGAHLTDASNASRTLLLDIGTATWSEELCALFGVPARMLPEVVPSSGVVGTTDPIRFLGIRAPISGVAGDQQAALFGQACLRPGMAKNTYGTGSFVLLQSGERRLESGSGMLTTVAWLREGRLEYALEGAIFVTGAALQWLRDGLGIIASAAEAGPLAESIAGTGGVYLVPAFAGLGAPHWDPGARATISGLTRGSGRAEVVRAAVEAMAFQTAEVVEAMAADAGGPFRELRVDGGASVMNFLCQFQADLLGIPVRRPRVTETTALGASFLAGRGAGLWANDQDLAGAWRLDREFLPAINRDEAATRLAGWRAAVARSRS